MLITYSIDKRGAEFKTDRLRHISAAMISRLGMITECPKIVERLIVGLKEFEDHLCESSEFYFYFDRIDKYTLSKERLFFTDDLEILIRQNNNIWEMIYMD